MRDGVGDGVRRGGVGEEGGGKRDGVQLASARLGRAGIATQGPSYAGLARIRTHSRTFWPLTLSPPQPAASAPIASRAAGQSRVPVCRPLGWHRRDSGGSDPTPTRIVCSPCEASEAVSTPASSTMRSRSSVSESALQALRSSGTTMVGVRPACSAASAAKSWSTAERAAQDACSSARSSAVSGSARLPRRLSSTS